jgi:hypothetical protein
MISWCFFESSRAREGKTQVEVRVGRVGRDRTLNLRIKSPIPECIRRLSTLFENVHRRSSEP